ncbi:MAG: hypothetical protein JWP91_138 [Fibrobacteres bacterium]|nr:hypothetical protein [Fibrobacterota bacterium]
MSTIDPRTKDPAEPHHSENGGHELSDFSWTTVLWLIPLSVVILVVFFAVCIAWFKGAKDREIGEKQAMFNTTELNQLRAKENETLTQFKYLDKEKGRVQISIARAMELIAQEHQNKPGLAYKPITDTYLQGAAFEVPALAATNEGTEGGISIETAPEPNAPTKGAKPTKPTAPKVSGKAAVPAMDASKQKSSGGPGGGASEQKAH